MSCNNTNSTCTNCNHNYSSCNNKCAKCGCKDSFLTSPPPCPTPNGCPDPVPCQEVLSSDCVIYTGDPIMCDDIVIIPSDSTMTEALIALADFMCGCCGGTHTPVSFKCLTGVCFDPGDGSGPYDTIDECDTYCTTPPQPSWNCVNGACINPGNGSGDYLSLSECYDNCPSPLITWACNNGTCESVNGGTGQYGTLDQCQQFCEDVYVSFNCLNGECTDPGDGSGRFATFLECIGVCTDPPQESWTCFNGNCTDPGDGSGNYDTQVECESFCTDPPQPSWTCFFGECTDPGDGSGVHPTLLDCIDFCVPVPDVSYNCIGGNCIDPGDGTGLYDTENACWIECDPFTPISPCVTTCASSLIQAPLPGATLVFSAYTITSTSSYTPLTFFNPAQIVLCNSSYTYIGSSWAIWGAGQLVPNGPFLSIIPFTYTLNFSSPINNVFIFLHEYSAFGPPSPNSPEAESFVFTTNAGFVDITCADYCCATITGGNTVTAMSGPGINCPADPNFCGAGICSGSGTFIISSSLPYTSLTITGTGGAGGTHIGLCEDQFGTSSTSTIYTTFDALPIPAVSYNCVNCLCNNVSGPGGTYATLEDCLLDGCNDAFTTTWETTTAGESITLPYYLGGTYSGTIDWGDSTTSANGFATSTHIYATPGIYTITICGTTTGWNFNTTPASRSKIKSVVTWGQLRLGANLGSYFASCNNLDLSSVSDTLDLFGTGITNFQNMFALCTSLTTINNINSWNTTAITNMTGMFNQSTLFNQPLSFNTAAVTNMFSMFFGCTAFNSLLTFNTIAVTSMGSMFMNCINFNTPITFNTIAVTSMNSMFRNCSNFNSAVSFTSTPLVNDTSRMFDLCINFNQPLTFNTPVNTTTFRMFANCTSFNSPLIFTNTGAVTTMASMFFGCSVFNQPLTLNTGAVINMSSMFRDATAFNGTLTFSSTALVTDMANMFQDAPAFQQYIGTWNISNVVNFGLFMFGKTPATWPTAYFDDLLCQWSLQTVTPLIIIDFGSANYTTLTGGPCRTVLQSPPKNWAINSGPGV